MDMTAERPAPEKNADKNTKFQVICDICDGPVIETGSRNQLERSGWQITRNCAFCPLH